MAPRNGNPRQCSKRLHAALVTVLVTVPLAFATMTAAAAASGQPHPTQAARFSDLTELTPANVQGLLPLVARIGATLDNQDDSQRQRSSTHALKQDSLADVDARLHRFVDERAHMQLAIEELVRAPLAAVPGREMSFLIDTRATGTPGEPELRAWDPVERRVVWSVTEALPISGGALITAGGLIFYGTTDGWLKALDARTGRTLWQHRTQGRKLDEPFSYRGSDGHQYIAARSLPPGPGRDGATLLTFALPH